LEETFDVSLKNTSTNLAYTFTKPGELVYRRAESALPKCHKTLRREKVV